MKFSFFFFKFWTSHIKIEFECVGSVFCPQRDLTLLEYWSKNAAHDLEPSNWSGQGESKPTRLFLWELASLGEVWVSPWKEPQWETWVFTRANLLCWQDLPSSLSPPSSPPPSSTSENCLASSPSARFLPDGYFQWESWPMRSLSCSAFLSKSLIPKSLPLW